MAGLTGKILRTLVYSAATVVIILALLIGEVAEVAHDEFETPIGDVYGVEIIGNTIATLLRNGPLVPASVQAEIFVAFVLMMALLATITMQNPMPRNLNSRHAVVLILNWNLALWLVCHLRDPSRSKKRMA